MGPVILRHDASARHDTGAHPERIARIRAIEAALGERDWLGWEVVESPPATDAQLHALHPPAYCAALEAACREGGGLLDADTVVCPASYEAARRAAGGAAALVDALVAGAPVGASLHRPPGHHAEAARAMGFCLFNNVAVAARHALDAHGLERVLIVDWDVHHGNGTNDLFHADPRVLFCSIHEWPLYPGSGSSADQGSGAGLGYTMNLPVPSGSGDAVFTSMVEHVVLPVARSYAPQLILISAGYDAHADDPLAGCEVSDAGYAAMAGALRRFAAELEVPLGVVLEGGYDLGALARGVLATLETLGRDPGGLAPAEREPHPLALDAAQRVAGRLPA